ncbi:hypothetical protein Tco_1363042 [Tanacetum coccineum]
MLNSLQPFRQPWMSCSHRFASKFAKNTALVLRVVILHQSLFILGLSAFNAARNPVRIEKQLAVYKFEGDAFAWWKEPIRQGPKEERAAGTAEEQAKNFRWGLHKVYYDEGPSVQDNRHKSGDRYHPYSQQGSHKSHGQSDDRQRSDRQGSDRQNGGSNYRNNNNNNHSRDNNRNSGAGREQRNRGQQCHRSTNSFQQSRYPPEGLDSLCLPHMWNETTPGECRRGCCNLLQIWPGWSSSADCKKNTVASSSGHATRSQTIRPGVFALTQIRLQILQIGYSTTVLRLTVIPSCFYFRDIRTPRILFGMVPYRKIYEDHFALKHYLTIRMAVKDVFSRRTSRNTYPTRDVDLTLNLFPELSQFSKAPYLAWPPIE